jgi:hypothetical protein
MPPSPVQLADRLSILGALGFRGLLEAEPSAQDALAMMARVTRWAHDADLGPGLTREELRLFSYPYGGWDPAATSMASWHVDAASALGWAIGLIEQMPPYDRGAGMELLRLLPFSSDSRFAKAGSAPREEQSSLRSWARLRPSSEILAARECASLWLWRSRSRTLMLNGVENVEASIREAASRALERGMIASVREQDFEAFGKAYRDLSRDEWETAHHIAWGRLHALNWICGDELDWDRVECL